MSDQSESVLDFVKELQIQDKVLPNRNPDIAWFWIFLPALFGYISLLMSSLNGKPIIGSVHIYNEALFGKIAQPSYPMEVIATGNTWTEGPLWINNGDSQPFLLFSDTVHNEIYKWEEGKGFFTIGKTLYLTKSGCKKDPSSDNNNNNNNNNNNSTGTSEVHHCDRMYEPGSNGLARVLPLHYSSSDTGNLDLLIAQHGERAISLQRNNGTRSILAAHYKGKKLNSPNDLVWSKEGHLYFTDPLYGLIPTSARNANLSVETGAVDDNLRELSHCGLYMIHYKDIVKSIETGQEAEHVYLIDKAVASPNGLAFSPGYSKLYVSNSLNTNRHWTVYDVNPNGLAHKGKTFFTFSDQDGGTADGVQSSEASVNMDGDVTIEKQTIDDSSSQEDEESKKVAALKATILKKAHPNQNADGMAVDVLGNVYASGPGGVIVFSPEGQIIGSFNLDRPVSNLAFGSDGYLYMTAADLVIRKYLKVKGAVHPSYK